VVASGRPARTDFRLLEVVPRASFVEARPLTGRTHQIRVHLAHLKHPVVGDALYGGHPERGLPSRELRAHLEGLGRFLLHARRLEFTSPSGEAVAVECPPPPEFAATMEAFVRHG
jgi:23S rRNA pseudouridine1911/1915/1917 synthase